jgi:pimeloyl-ACP methyl ester carboxylesterase
MPVTAEDLTTALAALRKYATCGTLDVGRYRMRYFVWGSGPPVVFIHGMADAAEAFAMVMHRLADRFTCVGYELPNGLNDHSHLNRYRSPDYIADLFALLDHLKLCNNTIVGSSFGSIIALAALAKAPEQFTHAVLQNGFAYRPLNRFQRMLARTARFWPGWFADWPQLHSFVMRRIEHATISSVPPEVSEFYLKHGANTPIAAACLRALAIDRADHRRHLPAIHVPVLLLCGDCDRLVPQVCWDDLARGLPNATRRDIAGCGHYPQYTHPREMAEVIVSFLSPKSPGES